MSANTESNHPAKSVLLIAVLLSYGHISSAADFGGYVALTTDYVKRGVTQSDNDPAVQIGADVGFDNGFFIGAWGSTVDISNGPVAQRDVELNYYAGYALDISDSWQLSLSAVAYDFPGQSGNVDYNYEEYFVGVGFNDRVWLDYAYSPDIYNTGNSTTNVELMPNGRSAESGPSAAVPDIMTPLTYPVAPTNTGNWA